MPVWSAHFISRMPHPVGGAMGVTLFPAAREKGVHPLFNIILLNIHKTTSRAGIGHGCCTLTSTADFCLPGKAPSQLFYSPF